MGPQDKQGRGLWESHGAGGGGGGFWTTVRKVGQRLTEGRDFVSVKFRLRKVLP